MTFIDYDQVFDEVYNASFRCLFTGTTEDTIAWLNRLKMPEAVWVQAAKITHTLTVEQYLSFYKDYP